MQPEARPQLEEPRRHREHRDPRGDVSPRPRRPPAPALRAPRTVLYKVISEVHAFPTKTCQFFQMNPNKLILNIFWKGRCIIATLKRPMLPQI